MHKNIMKCAARYEVRYCDLLQWRRDMEHAKDWHFPMACPGCQAIRGMPQRVTTDDVTVTVHVLCSVCLNGWSVAAPAPSMFLTKKADRRGALDD
jgi:hypothetical protein